MVKRTQRSNQPKAASPKKSRAAKSSRSPRASSTKSTARRTTKQTTPSKRPTRKAAKRSGRRVAAKSAKTGTAIRKTVNGYVSTLNDWRKECVGGLRKIIRNASSKSSKKDYEHRGPVAWIKARAKHVKPGFWRNVELPDPRKLLKSTEKRIRQIKLSSLKDAGKRELRELMRLAAKLNEIKGSPKRRPRPKSKRK